jgi:dTDP-4-amino-4,6-dideoxy-D-galactose acyltransferase
MSPVVEPAVCQFLEWDSRFFERKIGRLTSPRLSPAMVPAVLAWCQANQIACLYFLADADDTETAQLAAEHGFLLTDVRVTLEHGRLTDMAPAALAGGEAIRPFVAGDLPALRDLAGRSHMDSRFFFDQHFPPALSRQLFETWIEKSCLNKREKVFVAELENKPAGYITCQFVNEQTGQIGLLGVDAAAQGRGVGSGLIKTALGWFAAQGATRAIVVTQGRNIRAQRLYQRCGFVTASLQLWYHRWFASAATGGEPR